jgi:signal transduction histidine kinase
MFLFAGASWYILKSYYEREALNDATMHLTVMKKAYQTQIKALIQNLDEANATPAVTDLLVRWKTKSSQVLLDKDLSTEVKTYKLSSLTILSTKSAVLAQAGEAPDPQVVLTANKSLIEQGSKGFTATTLEISPAGGKVTSSNINGWDIDFVIPLKERTGKQIGVLLAAQHIDETFAADLINNASTYLNVLLCASTSKRIIGTTMSNVGTLIQHVSEHALCEPRVLNQIDGAEHYLAASELLPDQDQLKNSPSLVIVDIEPLYNITAHTEKAVLIMAGLAVFIIALGVTAYVLIAKQFFVRPIRRLQARVAALVADNSDAELTASTIDELSMLTRSFSLLSESLDTRENESNVITKQMGELLAMSDVLISTLNLEDLLGEIVSRLGQIMLAKGVSLLLYGREMQSPWAVARWSSQQQSSGSIPAANLSSQNGAVTVHTDPGGDITMTATTKMAAIVAPATRTVQSSSGKRSAIRALKLTSQTEKAVMPLPRIPRPALRKLDLILARMAMQKQKIIYGEDIEMIYQERGETWSQLALEAGYRSVIAVSLQLQEQAIGAIVLYGDRPYQVSRRDTFLLSTAAIQAAMAIQNALLFAEVKDKNAALERVNHLKSQFLATVTHELRTPLHSIISYGALILEGFVEGELTAEQEEHIQFIVRRAEDLSRLVDDMLDLSKIEADRLEVKVEPLELESSLAEAVDQLKPMANTKGLQLTLEVEDTLPKVLADSQRMRQVVINMVSNALKFTEKGGVTIRCAQLERYDMLRISVCDTGIGISPAALEYIFEAFRQADGSTTRRFGGTGLGLTIARKLIELQGGEVSVESIVGQGSTFSFTLPIASPSRVRV